MSWHAVDVAYRTSDGLSAPEAAVYYAYAYHADRDGKAWPSVATLCNETRFSRATVRRAIRSLVDKSRIRTTYQPGTALTVHLTALTVHTDRAHPAHRNLNRTVKNRAAAARLEGAAAVENQSSAAPWLEPAAIDACPYCDVHGFWERRDGSVARCSHRMKVPDDVGTVLRLVTND
jgi:hypothetical protein